MMVLAFTNVKDAQMCYNRKLFCKSGDHKEDLTI